MLTIALPKGRLQKLALERFAKAGIVPDEEPGVSAAMQKAFALTPAQLGRAAIKAAAPTTARRAAAKRVHRARG